LAQELFKIKLKINDMYLSTNDAKGTMTERPSVIMMNYLHNSFYLKHAMSQLQNSKYILWNIRFTASTIRAINTS
jgi:hypothetical protein